MRSSCFTALWLADHAGSYDYGSPIRETRLLTDKYDEVKRQGIFLRSSPQFRKTEWVGESATGIPGITINNSLAYGTYLRNPDSGTGFLITRQNDSTSTYASSSPHPSPLLAHAHISF